ncbi:mechanosensitive ion channel domain-containing protein [Shewanella gelidii]|uniref:Mechanosensitive ion channel protein MscS n=1 Tax=Shewanella gelidii TaxID=1642821 RepID=A0A917JRT6_9GAMM|nr:mechanosensitive ion channel domain-containing protein [Shewanella gelidii]MCL1097733.1 mechanosensitive ion channel [Shewanella gelidii]GGI79216.1 mechanosensitive ion channel protein MscS [Shewanella gelidii]
MMRALLFILLLLPTVVTATTSPTLGKSLQLPSQSTSESLPAASQQQNLDAEIARIELILQAYIKQKADFSTQKQKLNTQLALAQTPLKWTKKHLNQQASMAYVRQSELKESDDSLRRKINELHTRQSNLPQVISSARQELLEAQKALQLPRETPAGKRQQSNIQRLEMLLSALKAEYENAPQQIELSQLSLQVIRAQLSQQEGLIEELNRLIAEERQAKTQAAIAGTQSEESQSDDPFVLRQQTTNAKLVQQLHQLNAQLNDTVGQQESAEKQYQLQVQQLSNIQEQIAWVQINSAFGERFLQLLHALPKPANIDRLQARIADTRLNRYEAEQALSLNLQHQNQADLEESMPLTKDQMRVLSHQQQLLNQIIEGQDLLLAELAKLRLSYEQLNHQLTIMRSTLNEQLFWVPNASRINKLWISEFHQSVKWILAQNHWQLITTSIDEESDYWSWWIILFVLCLAAQDILTPRFANAMASFMTYVGNVTLDKFIYTFKALVCTFSYALLKPFPVIVAGVIFMQASSNLSHALGLAILAVGLLYLLYRLIALLAQANGLLVGHFKHPADVINQCFFRFNRFYVFALPLLGIFCFTQMLDLSLVRNSIGRTAFIALCILLFLLYKDFLKISLQYRQFHLDGKNKKLIQKLLWGVLLTVPIISAVLAFNGFYYTAIQLLSQLQLSLFVGLGFLLLYQLIKRWMLIARRQIAFDRAKTKRAEQLAARERGDPLATSLDPLENYEEPIVDLETISSQSLGLVRSLIVLALLASLLGLWTQTHTALFSFFDEITLWTNTAVVNGIEQQVPVTIKSILFGLIIMGFSLMIATNLPGLLELMVLQRLDLSPGTGFAITTVSRYLVVFFGLLIGFSTLGMEWSKLQWLVAALSVGLGFGLQEIFANFISGLIILFEKPIRIGDTVTIRDLTGTVSKIQIRATTIIDWDRKEIIVPNKAFITEQLVNWSLSDPITRVIVYVSVARDSDPSKVEASLYQAVQECEDALSSPEPEVWFAGFGQHTQDFEVRAYAKDMSARWPLKHKLHKRITKKLKENNLELAYPQMEIHINNPTKDPSGLLRG